MAKKNFISENDKFMIFVVIVGLSAALFVVYIVFKEIDKGLGTERYCFKKSEKAPIALETNSSTSTTFSSSPVIIEKKEKCSDRDRIILKVESPCLGVKPGDDMPKMSCGEMHFDTAVQVKYN